MALREDQIQRYGRQILLREVGGRGQGALISRAVQVLERTPAIDVAITYLAAGGTPVRLDPAAPGFGFLAGTSPTALNPDALEPAPVALSLGAQQGDVQIRGGGVLCASGEACDRLISLEGDAPPVVLGSAAALLIQRILLGKADGARVLRWAAGALHAEVGPRCPAHG